MEILRRYGILIFVLAMALAMPFVFAAYPTRFVLQYLVRFDPNGIYSLQTIIHRTIQFLLVMVLLKLYFKQPYKELGFNFNNIRLSKRIIIWIAVLWPVVSVLVFFIALHAIDGFKESLLNLFPIGSKKIYSAVGQDALMLNAFAEEPLYRSFVILVLLKYREKEIKLFSATVSHAVIISAFIFMFAHISFSIYPFEITYVDPLQLGMTLCTGLIFGIAFEKTKSLFAPVVLHSYTNVIITLVGYLFSASLR